MAGVIPKIELTSQPYCRVSDIVDKDQRAYYMHSSFTFIIQSCIAIQDLLANLHIF